LLKKILTRGKALIMEVGALWGIYGLKWTQKPHKTTNKKRICKKRGGQKEKERKELNNRIRKKNVSAQSIEKTQKIQLHI
jgi:hypothetical protein